MLIAEFYSIIDSNYYNAVWSADKATNLNKVMFTLGQKEYTQTDFAKYLECN